MKAISLLFMVFLAACDMPVSTLYLTCYSNPNSATLYQEDKSFGQTSLYLTYPLSRNDIKNGYVTIKKLHVRWVSGATASLEDLRIDLSKGLFQQITFNRPDNIKGIERDEHYELEMDKIRIQHQAQQVQQEPTVTHQLMNALCTPDDNPRDGHEQRGWMGDSIRIFRNSCAASRGN